MVWGLAYHALFSFTEIGAQDWLVQDSQHSFFVDNLLYLSHIVRMPLFFMLSGFFDTLYWQKYSPNAFIKQRLKRILAPFLLFSILFVPVWIALVVLAAHATSSPTTMIQTIVFKMQTGERSLSGLPVGHLWFLYYLLMFSLIYAVGRLVIKSSFKINKISSVVLIAAIIIMQASALYLAPEARVAAPPKGLIPDWHSFIYYLEFFFIGSVLYQKQRLINTEFNQVVALSGLLLLSCGALVLGSGWYGQSSLAKALSMLCYVCAALGWSLVLMQWAHRFMTQLSAKWQYFSESSYWVYIIHVPIIALQQIQMQHWELALILKATTILSVSAILSLLSYHLLVRSTWIGLLLNGRKHPFQFFSPSKQMMSANN